MKRISYNPLWKKLVDKGWLKRDLQQKLASALEPLPSSDGTRTSPPPFSSRSPKHSDCGLTDIAEIVEVIESVKGDNDAKAH